MRDLPHHCILDTNLRDEFIYMASRSSLFSPPNVSSAFFLAESNKAFFSSALSGDRLLPARSFFADIYAAEACSELSNEPMYRPLPPQYILAVKFPDFVSATPVGRSLSALVLDFFSTSVVSFGAVYLTLFVVTAFC